MSVEFRQAREEDARGIRHVFRACYGDDYFLPGVYHLPVLREWISGAGVLVYVAVTPDGAVLGTAMLDLRPGEDRGDRIGEFGRLCVLPWARGRRVGTRLMEVRLEAAERRIALGFAETRAAEPASTAIGLRQGFRPVGFFPSKDRFGRRESSVFMVRHFGDALARRRRRPRVVPEAAPLARHVLRTVGLADDLDVTHPPESSRPEPDASVGLISTGGRCGGERLTAVRDGGAAGRLAWRWSRRHRRGRLRTLQADDDGARRALLAGFVEAAERRGALYLEAEVQAGEIAAQEALADVGFRAGAYVPAGAATTEGRTDLLRMVRVHAAADLGPVDLHPAARRVAALVTGACRARSPGGAPPRAAGLLLRLIEEKDLEVETIVGTHGRPGTVEELRAALEAARAGGG